jgi:hypothetical protein
MSLNTITEKPVAYHVLDLVTITTILFNFKSLHGYNSILTQDIKTTADGI